MSRGGPGPTNSRVPALIEKRRSSMEQLGNPVFVCPECGWEHYGLFKEDTGGTTCVYCGHWQECEHIMYTDDVCVTCGKKWEEEG
jgi:DNA-directed RNA polymerase subunit RPC12/RpoP